MKIISMILAFIMSLFGITPAFQPVEAYTQAEWYALVADEFNLTYDLEDEDNYDIAEDDEYFEVIQACYDWNVIVGEYDADADATNFVVAKSLAAAAGLEGVKDADDDAAFDVAVDLGIVEVSVNLFGKVKEVALSKEEANAALKAAGLAHMNALKDVENKGSLTTDAGEEIGLESLALVENAAELNVEIPEIRGEMPGQDYPLAAMSMAQITSTALRTQHKAVVMDKLLAVTDNDPLVRDQSVLTDETWKDLMISDDHAYGSQFPAGPAMRASYWEKGVYAMRRVLAY